MRSSISLVAAALPVVLAWPPPSSPWGPPAWPPSKTSVWAPPKTSAWGPPTPPGYAPTPPGYGPTPPGYGPTPTSSSPNPLFSIIHAVECEVVDVVVDVLKLIPTATPFCQSFLHIPAITSTERSTKTKWIPTTSTDYDSTTTVTLVSIPTITATSIVTSLASTVIDTSIVTTTLTASTTLVVPYCSGTPVSISAPAKRDVDVPVTARTLPTPKIPLPLRGFLSAEISTACECLDVPAPTSTTCITSTATSTSTAVHCVTATTTTTELGAPTTTTLVITSPIGTTITSIISSTVTITPSTTTEDCPAPTLCGNQGLQFAVYHNVDGQNAATNYPTFDPESYKTMTPECTGVTNTIGGFDYAANPNGLTIYNECAISTSDYFVINHRGYIYAEQTGTYTFTVTQPDDIVLLWVGPLAYSGWTRSNAQLVEAYGDATTPYTITLTAGLYYALRIVYGQAQGAASFEMTVTAPDGSVFLGSSTGASPYLVQFSCDGVTAPAYEPFGSET